MILMKERSLYGWIMSLREREMGVKASLESLKSSPRASAYLGNSVALILPVQAQTIRYAKMVSLEWVPGVKKFNPKPKA